MGRIVRTVFEVAAAVVVGVVAGPGAGFLFLGAELAVDTAISTLLMKTPNSGGFGASQLSFQGDPTAGVPYVIGRTGFAGRMVKQGSSGDKPKSGSDPEKPNYYLHQLGVLSLGPIQAIDTLKIGQDTLAFDGAGAATTTSYAGDFWMASQLGAPPYVAMTQPVGSLAHSGAWSGWDSDHKLSSLAAIWYVCAAENPPFESGPPQGVLTLEGVYVYDPRLDDTQTALGGAGACRVDDETTWPWSENPFLHGITYALGRYRAGKRVIGLGAPMAAIDVAAYVAGANVCDANAWAVGGVIYSTDDKKQTLNAILEAGGGKALPLRAQLSCTWTAPRTSIATLTGSDLAGVPQIAKVVTRRNRLNSVIPSYRSEDHGWQIVAANPVRVDAYVTADGEERSKEYTFNLVQNPTGSTPDQAAQLARYMIENSREPGPIAAPVRARWLGLKPNDCITWDEPAMRLSSQKAVIAARTIDPGKGVVTLTCTGETDAKHTAALAQVGVAPPVPPPS